MDVRQRFSNPTIIACVSVVSVVAVFFMLTWDYQFSMADGNFYRYGVQRVLAGDIPIRDFYAYDPLRYYWTAGLVKIVGVESVFMVRLGGWLFFTFPVVLIVRHVLEVTKKNWVQQIAISISLASLFVVWNLSAHKAFDVAASLWIILLLLYLQRSRALKNWFFCGFLLGFIALIGRNHGLYGTISVLILFGIMAGSKPGGQLSFEKISTFIAGGIVGYLPNLIALVFVDGYGVAFIDTIRLLIAESRTNLALPVPWPWLVDFAGAGVILGSSLWVLGLFFVAVLVYPPFMTLVVLRKGKTLPENTKALLIASILGGLVYLHYIFSRADYQHLALGIYPLIFGISVLVLSVNSRLKILSLWALTAASVFALSIKMSYFTALAYGYQTVQLELGNEKINVYAPIEETFKPLILLTSNMKAGGYSFLALPHLMGLHAIHKQHMIVHNIYPIWPSLGDEEARDIGRIDSFRPDFIIISNHPMDDSEDHRFNVIRSKTFQWIEQNYVRCVYDHSSGDVLVFARESVPCLLPLRLN